MPSKKRTWSIIKRADIANFRLKHGLSKVGTARALGVSPISLAKWMKGGEPPLLSKQDYLKGAMAAFDKKPEPVAKASAKAKIPAAPKQKRKAVPALPGVTGSKDELILQIVLEHLQSGSRIDDIPAYIRQIKKALG